MDGKFQNDIIELSNLSDARYENIFRVYNVEDTPNNFFFYNITKKVCIRKEDIDSTYLVDIVINRNLPWTTLAYKIYANIYLWWLLFLLNPQDDIFTIKAGTVITAIKPEYIDQVIQIIKEQVNK